MNTCQLYTNCKSPATHTVIHKAFMAKPERRIEACKQCASRIGSRAPGGAVINTPSKENRFYKLISNS